jgi:hypothetical protein
MEKHEVHVFPLFGRKHILCASCWCHPDRDGELFVHNAEQ